MRKITKIIVHCSATPEGRDVSVETIRGWHVNERGWSDIGYHFIIGLDGEVHEGRPIENTGAHCKGENYCSIGICYIGGMDKEMKDWKDTRTPEQIEAIEDFLLCLKDQYPSARIYGHRDFSKKACPSYDAKEEYDWISNRAV